MVHKKSKSKRVGLKTKYMVDRKVKEFKRKMRKEARNNPNKRPSIKKDPGIPNLWPFKEQLIRQAVDEKEKVELMKQQQKAKRQQVIDRLRKAAAKDMEVDYKKDTQRHQMKDEEEKDYSKRRWYFRELNKVISEADVILEVLDARDPMGCRCIDIERRIQSLQASKETGAAKKLILVINKIDLVPVEIVNKWVKHLRREFPTIAFKASTQQQGNHLGQSKLQVSKTADNSDLSVSSTIGGGALMQLLKNYARSFGTKKAITVGIVGYPNVGKSSLINSLKRSRAVTVGATPGVTKTLQTIRLDSNISLLDSPGVLFADGASQADLVLRNCLKLEDVEDPVTAVYKIVEKAPAEHLMELYEIAEFSSPEEFLSHVAHKRGKLGKGGVPNLDAAAVTVIKDWTSGFIPFYTIPPEIKQTKHDNTEMVGDWGKEFDINALLRSADEEVKVLDKPRAKAQNFISMDANTPFAMREEEEENEDEEDEDLDEDDDEDDDGRMSEDEEDEEEEKVALDTKKLKKGGKMSKSVVSSSSMIGQDNQRNKQMKKAQKKNKKAASKGKEMDDDDLSDAPYNFETDFQ